MKKEYADYILQKTQEDYNKIADQFSATRAFVWEDIKPLAKYVQDGDRVLDLGCGNGRLLQLFLGRNVEYIGVDSSERLIEIAKKNYELRIMNYGLLSEPKFLVADALNLPFPDNYFDKIYSIAVLHHIPSEEYRLKFLREARRVLKPGGLLILTVWNLLGFKNFFKLLFSSRRKSLWLAAKYNFLKVIGRSNLDFNDVLVSWGKTCQRYIHQFTQGELKRTVQDAGFTVEQIGILLRPEMKDSNIYLLAKK